MSTNISIEQMVNTEVNYCVSSVVYALSHGDMGHPTALGRATEQAIDLYRGPVNYEDAARDEGWEITKVSDGSYRAVNTQLGMVIDDSGCWKDLCEEQGIEPYENAVLEHWIVSNWLADKLIAKGETVEKDFMGLVVWGRTTSGQYISNDPVIQDIYSECRG